jgi:hypothetical protein
MASLELSPKEIIQSSLPLQLGLKKYGQVAHPKCHFILWMASPKLSFQTNHPMNYKESFCPISNLVN